MNRPSALALLLSVLLCFVFLIFPLPDWMTDYRPPLILLLVIYIQCFLPAVFSLIGLFLVSLCMDALLFQVFGSHGFALFSVTWLINSMARRFRFFSMGQQLLLIALLSFLYQFILLSIYAICGVQPHWLQLLILPLLAMLFWPWVKILADDLLQTAPVESI